MEHAGKRKNWTDQLEGNREGATEEKKPHLPSHLIFPQHLFRYPFPSPLPWPSPFTDGKTEAQGGKVAPPKVSLSAKLRIQDSEPGVCNSKCVVILCGMPPTLGVSSWVMRLERTASWAVFAV